MHTRRHFLMTVILRATVSSFEGALAAAGRAASQARKLLNA